MEAAGALGGVVATSAPADVRSTLTSVPMHMLEVKDYRTKKAAAEIYHHRERLTGRTFAGKATEKDHEDYVREIRFCKEEMTQVLNSCFDNAVKDIALEEGFSMIKGYVDLRKFYAKPALYSDKMRRLVFLAQYGIFEPGRDDWLRQAEVSFLSKKGWKYDDEERLGNMTLKEKTDVGCGVNTDDQGIERREDKKQGRKKVGFVRHHFVHKKEDFCRALKTIGWKAHGEAITKKKPKRDGEFGYDKKDYYFHARNFGQGCNGYILTPKPDIVATTNIPENVPHPIIRMMQGLGEKEVRKFVAVAFGGDKETTGGSIADGGGDVSSSLGVSLGHRQYSPIGKGSPQRFHDVQRSRPSTADDDSPVRVGGLGLDGTPKKKPSDVGGSSVSPSRGATNSQGLSVGAEVDINCSPSAGTSSSSRRVRQSPPSSLEKLSTSTGHPITNEELCRIRMCSVLGGGNLSKSGGLVDFLNSERKPRSEKKPAPCKRVSGDESIVRASQKTQVVERQHSNLQNGPGVDMEADSTRMMNNKDCVVGRKKGGRESGESSAPGANTSSKTKRARQTTTKRSSSGVGSVATTPSLGLESVPQNKVGTTGTTKKKRSKGVSTEKEKSTGKTVAAIVSKDVHSRTASNKPKHAGPTATRGSSLSGVGSVATTPSLGSDSVPRSKVGMTGKKKKKNGSKGAVVGKAGRLSATKGAKRVAGVASSKNGSLSKKQKVKGGMAGETNSDEQGDNKDSGEKGVVDEYGKVLLEDGSLVHLVGAGLSVLTCMNKAQMECVYNLCRECVARKKEEILEGRDLDPTFPVNKRRHDSYVEGKLHCEVCRTAGLFDHSLRREECPDFFTQAFFRARDAVESKRDYFRYCAGCKAENWGWDVGKEIPQRRQFPAAEDTDEILAV